MEQKNTKKGALPWKLYFVLLGLTALGSLGLVPSAPAMFSGVQQSMPMPLFLLAVFLQGFLIAAVCAFLGLLLSRKTGLGAPPLEDLVYRKRGNDYEAKRRALAGVLGFAVLAGLAAGAVITALDVLFVRFIEIELVEGASAPGWWRGLLSSFYGGINEELVTRLFVMNLLLWLLGPVFRKKSTVTTWKIWTAVLVSALIFGASHLGAAQAMMNVTALVVARIMVINFVPGVVFGVLFWKRGLLAAMAAHFAADVLIHGLVPLLFPAVAA